MRSKRVVKQSKLMRYIKGPIRVLARAGELYVQSLTGGGAISYGNAVGCPMIPQMQSVGYNSSTSCETEEEKSRDLTSTRNRAGEVDDTVKLRHSKRSFARGRGGGAAVFVPRSATAPFERIDEEK